jgi:hypothetical protein
MHVTAAVKRTQQRGSTMTDVSTRSGYDSTAFRSSISIIRRSVVLAGLKSVPSRTDAKSCLHLHSASNLLSNLATASKAHIIITAPANACVSAPRCASNAHVTATIMKPLQQSPHGTSRSLGRWVADVLPPDVTSLPRKPVQRRFALYRAGSLPLPLLAGTMPS